MLSFTQADFQKWLKDTDLGFGKMRSAQLKQLDVALSNYTKTPTPENASKISHALNLWEASRKGPNASERDKNGAVTTLKVMLESGAVSGEAYRSANFSKEEAEAFKMMMDAKKNQLITTFGNASVVFVGNKPDPDGPVSKIKALVNKGKDAYGKASDAYGHATDAASAGKKAYAIGQKIAPVQKAMSGVASAMAPATSVLMPIINQIKEALLNMCQTIFGVAMQALGAVGQHILSLMTQVAQMVAPYISHLMDAKDMIIGWGKVGLAAVKKYDIGSRAYVLDTGAPAAALTGVHSCLTQELANNVAVAANATVSFTLKTVFAAGDYGAGSQIAVGIGSAMVELARQITNLAIEWRATQKLKELLKDPSKLDVSVFKTYPLMGAYMLVSVNVSDALPLTMFGTPGWMDILQKDKSGSFDKIYKTCEDLIQKSPWEIAGLPKRKVMTTKQSKAGFAKDTVSGLAGAVKDAVLS